VIVYGALVQKALAAAAEVERRNPYATVEVMICAPCPYDWEPLASVEKQPCGGARRLRFLESAEIAARIPRVFERLDAP